MDSFDTYSSGSSEVGQRWGIQSAVIASTAGARTGVGCASVPDGRAAATLGRVVGARATLIAGFGIFQNVMTSDDGFFCTFADGSTEQIGLYLNSNRTIGVYRGVALIGTTSYVLPVSTWVYLEMRVTFHASNGTIELRADGAPIYQASGISTIASANPSADRWYLVGRPSSNGSSVFSIGNTQFDDAYLCDSTGALNNGFLGPVNIHVLTPSGNGNSSQFTGSDGNSTDNYLLVDDVATQANDEDATYVQSSTAGQVDVYAYTNLGVTPDAILGILHFVRARHDSSAIGVAPQVRRGGVNYSAPAITVGATYQDHVAIMETDPSTSTSWTKANIDAAEFGVKVS